MPITRATEASQRRFGLEFEFTQRLPIGVFGSRLMAWFDNDSLVVYPFYRHSTGRYWELKTDSSCGYELASAAITWENWGQVSQALSGLTQLGAQVTQHCGFHVHHELRDYTPARLRRLATLWGALEPLGFALCDATRSNNVYCRPFREDYEPWMHFKGQMQTARRLRTRVRTRGRRLALNLTPYWRHGRAEFRLFHGTLDEPEVRHWTSFTQTIVELATRRIRERTIDRLADRPIKQQLKLFQELVHNYSEVDHVVAMLDELPKRARQDTATPSGWATVDFVDFLR